MSRELPGRRPCPEISLSRLWVEFSDGSEPRYAPIVRGLPAYRLVQHSPDGYEWGYAGSGPADLALNIAAACLPIGCDGHGAEKLFKGKCSRIAWRIHQGLKRQFLTRVPLHGAELDRRLIDAFIDGCIAQLESEGFFVRDEDWVHHPVEGDGV